MLKAYGAEVVVCPTAVAPEHPAEPSDIAASSADPGATDLAHKHSG